MKTLIFGAALSLAASTLCAQDTTREEIRRPTVHGPDTMEVVVCRLTVRPGATIPLHTHPGDQHAVVTIAATAKAPNGNTVEFAAGAPLFFPHGTVHVA